MHPSHNRGFVFAIAVILAASPFIGSAVGQLAATALVEDGPDSWKQDRKLQPTEPGGRLGDDLALDGTTLILGAPAANHVQVYELTDDGAEQRSFPSTPDTANAEYGTAVDIDGDLAAVGSNGIAFVFERTTSSGWEQVGTLNPPANPDDNQRRFGLSITVEDDTNTVLVGAQSEDTSAGENAGAAFVFTRGSGSWSLNATLTPDNPAEDNSFGAAVALEGTTALVGAPDNPDAGTATGPGGIGVPEAAGAAFVFQGGDAGWTQTAKLAGSQPTDDLAFGKALALDGERALIASEETAYVFDNVPAEPTEAARLVPNDRVTDEQPTRGSLYYRVLNVALDGDQALIGAPAANFGQPGQTYVFEEDNSGSWTQVTELRQRDVESHAAPIFNDGFGWAVALDGDRAIASAPGDDNVQGQQDGGAAYLFSPCTAPDGEISGPVHDEIAPQTGPAQADVHDVNCNVLASNGG
jgi:hypothetical protein